MVRGTARRGNGVAERVAQADFRLPQRRECRRVCRANAATTLLRSCRTSSSAFWTVATGVRVASSRTASKNREAGAAASP
jgi:hypothetical protein